MTSPGPLLRGPWDSTSAESDSGSPAAPIQPPHPKRSKALRERFRDMLGRNDAPEVVAASFAVGVAIAFTPLFGLHLWMALALAWVLRLKAVDVVLGTLVVNPLTFVPVSTAAIPIGRFVLRAHREASEALHMRELLTTSFWTNAGPKMKTVGLQWATGMFILSFVAGAITYVLVLRLIRHHRARRAAKAEAEIPVDPAVQTP